MALHLAAVLEVLHSYQAEAYQTELLLSGLTSSTAYQVGAALRNIDALLLDVLERLEKGQDVSSPDIQRLEGRIKAMPEVLDMLVVGRDGRIVAPTLTAKPSAGIDVSDREYFRFWRDHPADKALHVSTAVVSRVIGRPLIPISRPRLAADGSFAGVVAASLDVGFLNEILAAANNRPTGSGALLIKDGTLLARVPEIPDSLGKKVPHIVLSDRFSFVKEENTFDGPVRFIGTRPVGQYPLIVSSTLAVNEALSSWRRGMVETFGTSIPLSLAIYVMALIADRRDHSRRILAEALRAQRDNLEVVVKSRTAALLENEERFRSVVEGTTDWVWETDAEHRFSWLASSVGNTFVRPPETILGMRRRDLASHDHDRDDAQWQAHLEDLTARRGFRDFRYWIGLDGGEPRWISASGTPRFDGNGLFLGYRGTSSDVTDEATTALRMKMLSTAVEQSPVAVVITDPNGTIEYMNSHVTVTSGYQVEEAIGSNSRIFASGETPGDVYREMWATISAGRRWAGQLRNRRKDGALRWEAIVIAPVLNEAGRIAHYVAIKDDVTERRQMQDKLRQTNADLEQFAYVASHDMRQPLRMVSSYLALIEKRLGPLLADDIKDFLGFAIGGAKQMDSLILGLLEYSRTGRSAELVAVPLAEAVASARLNLTVALREADADIVVAAGLPTVAGDSTELSRLFQNLIGNAIKYHEPGRRPRIEIGSRRQGGDWVVWVKDNGIGIAAEDRERAFAIFQRLVPQDAFEGTGIGLAVCRKIVEHHGGRIWIESVPGEGSTFFFTLQHNFHPH